MKWVHLTTAPGQLQAEMWRDLLVEEGIPARVHPGDTASFLPVSSHPCRILVPEEQLDRAREVMEERLGLGQGEG